MQYADCQSLRGPYRPFSSCVRHLPCSQSSFSCYSASAGFRLALVKNLFWCRVWHPAWLRDYSHLPLACFQLSFIVLAHYKSSEDPDSHFSLPLHHSALLVAARFCLFISQVDYCKFCWMETSDGCLLSPRLLFQAHWSYSSVLAQAVHLIIKEQFQVYSLVH